MGPEITIEVVCALPQRQHLLRLRVPAGCTASDALARSGITELAPEIDWSTARLGVFGHPIERPHEHELADGDRLEIYRPLTRDPRAARRARERDSGRRRG